MIMMPEQTPSTELQPQHEDDDGACAVEAAIPSPSQEDSRPHPRRHLGAEWKWKGTVGVIFLTSMISGKPASQTPPPLFSCSPPISQRYGSRRKRSAKQEG